MTWPAVQLGRIATITGGSTPRRERDGYWGGTIPWLTPTDLPMPGEGIADVTETASYITEEGLASCAASLLPVGTVLYSSRATIGKLGIARAPLATNQGFANFIPGNAVESKYLAYCLQHHTDQIARLAGSTTFKEVTKSALKKFEIPLPTKSEQRQIVAILEQADALRRQRRAADEKAQRILPALFHKLFGDPLENIHGWEMVRLGDPRVAYINPRTTANGITDETELSFVAMADVDEVWGRIVGKRTRPYAEVKKGFTSFQNGDVIFAKITPCMQNGKAAIASDLHNGQAFGSTEFHVLRPGPKATAEWLYGLVRLNSFRRQAMASFTGSAGQQRVPADFLKGYSVPLPPMEVQRRFASAVQTILAYATSTDQTRNDIAKLLSLLLHRAFTGELTAGWREAHKDQLEAEMREQLAALEQAKAGKPKRGRKPRSDEAADPDDNGRHAGTDMYNKAALVTYIAVKCHDPQRPDSLGRTKLAKLFYLVQRRAEISLTDQFARRAAGPLDDAIHKFLNLARKQHWLALPKAQGALKPVVPGDNPQPAIDHVKQRWADALAVMDEVLDTMKGWGWRALERWATVENAAQQLAAEGKPVTLAAVKGVIAADPMWRPKLDRPEFADSEIASTLSGLRKHGYLPAQ